MGTIVTIGISVSNSILVVSFANDLRARDGHARPHMTPSWKPAARVCGRS